MKKLSRRHLNAVRKLIERYNTITMEEIANVFDSTNNFLPDQRGKAVADCLTGFGRYRGCTLCQTTVSLDARKASRNSHDCRACIHRREDCLSDSCIMGNGADTYSVIANAETPLMLLHAFRLRAEYLQNLLDEYTKMPASRKNKRI